MHPAYDHTNLKGRHERMPAAAREQLANCQGAALPTCPALDRWQVRHKILKAEGKMKFCFRLDFLLESPAFLRICVEVRPDHGQPRAHGRLFSRNVLRTARKLKRRRALSASRDRDGSRSSEPLTAPIIKEPLRRYTQYLEGTLLPTS